MGDDKMIPGYGYYLAYLFLFVFTMSTIFVFYAISYLYDECPKCNRKMKWRKIRYEYKGHYFGRYWAHICKSCKKEWFTERSSKLIEQRAKELGLFGKG